MKKLLFIFALLFAVSSCSFLPVKKMDIEQGNIITADKVKQLHPGMTKSDVEKIMGTPILINTFSGESRVDYIYTYKPGNGKTTEKSLILIFQHHVLKEIKGNMYLPN